MHRAIEAPWAGLAALLTWVLLPSRRGWHTFSHLRHRSVEQAVDKEERLEWRLGRRKEAHLEGRDQCREDERQGGDDVPHVHARRGGVDDVAGLFLQLLLHIGDLCRISQRTHSQRARTVKVPCHFSL
eukprot:scaffold10356_cov61-Phaeocystis_antarctica.AAC.4